MKGAEFVATLDEKPTTNREEAIIQAAVDRNYVPIQWAGIRSVAGSHSCILYVATDALAIGEPDDFVRVNVTHAGAQRLADLLGYALPTTKISDLIYEQAPIQIRPCVQPPDGQMAYTSRMVRHSQAVSAQINGRLGLRAPVGKDWVLTNKLVGHPDRAANYGWHVRSGRFRGPGGIPVLQPLGLAHDCHHVDYSQVLRFVHRRVLVDGKDMLLEDVLTNPELADLVSYEGALQITRHPGVPLEGSGEPAPLVCGG